MTTTIAAAMGSVPNAELAVSIVRTGFTSPACSASVRTLPAQSRLSSRSSKYSCAASKGGEPIHEVAHAKLHALDPDGKRDPEKMKDSRTREVEAESVAYPDYSFG